MKNEIIIKHNGKELAGHISIAEQTRSWVIFAHGSGSSRKSSRNNFVADQLNDKGHSTLLFDLLTMEEDEVYENRFNIRLLAERLQAATDWLIKSPQYKSEPIIYFGASTGAGAALMAAAYPIPSWNLAAVISRGGRPDLAEADNLNKVQVPVLLIVGDRDHGVIELNEDALRETPNGELRLIPGATHLFEEPGTLDAVVDVILAWLDERLQRQETFSGPSADV